MKNYILIFCFFVPAILSSQIVENFSDGDFTNNPVWNGTIGNFAVNASLQLQSKATATSKSYLSTPSEAFINASWESWVKINYNPSSSNYASIYIVSDRADISSECFGYYVQIGNTNDEISLYLQEGTKKTKIIDGADDRTNSNPAEVKIKVTRDADGNFALYSKLPVDADYILEGTTKNSTVQGSKYFGLLYSNTSTTGNAYLFDDILVSGDKFIDVVAPTWTNLEITGSNQLKLTFSEPMEFSNAVFSVNNEIGNPSDKTISADGTSVILTFSTDFEKGKIYTLTAERLTDLSGNLLGNTQKQFGIVEKPEAGDIVINEICFEAAENGEEYFEIYNTSHKVIDLSQVLFTTRKTDGTMNTGYFFPKNELLLPQQYLALTPSADSIRNVYLPLTGAVIVSSEKWYTLNNESGTFIIANATKDTIYDEIAYNSKWHHVLIKNDKGVSLEKINPILSGFDQKSWHSAASEVHYGTPGYKNSQFREMNVSNEDNQQVWVDPESFTPDNDGTNDVCFIRYKTDESGFVANVFVYNSIGVEVKHLAKNELLASDGYILWDGTNKFGKLANPNVYVIYFEMFHPEKGIKIIKKFPVVLSIR